MPTCSANALLNTPICAATSALSLSDQYLSHLISHLILLARWHNMLAGAHIWPVSCVHPVLRVSIGESHRISIMLCPKLTSSVMC